MRTRSENRSQKIRCPKCKSMIMHRIPDSDSYWERVDGIRMYHRWHQCTECGNDQQTCELPRARFDKMLAELDQLHAMKRDHDQLVDELRKQHKSGRKIARLIRDRDTADA